MTDFYREDVLRRETALAELQAKKANIRYPGQACTQQARVPAAKKPKCPSPIQIAQQIARHYGISVEDLLRRSYERYMINARQHAYFALRQSPKRISADGRPVYRSYQEIARLMDTSPNTVSIGARKHAHRVGETING